MVPQRYSLIDTVAPSSLINDDAGAFISYEDYNNRVLQLNKLIEELENQLECCRLENQDLADEIWNLESQLQMKDENRSDLEFLAGF